MSVPRRRRTNLLHEDLQDQFRHLPGWLGRRLQDGEPLITEADGKQLKKKIDALLRRSSKLNTKYQTDTRNAERFVIIDYLTHLNKDTRVIECMFELLSPVESIEERGPAGDEVDRVLSDIERRLSGEDVL